MSILGRRLCAFQQDERGGLAVLAVFLAMVMTGMMAFVINVGLLYHTKVKLQKISEAAALGSVLSAPDSTRIVNAAANLASLNTPGAYGKVTTNSDVSAGFYSATASTFTAGAQPYNAVKVTASRAADHGNALFTFMGSFIGRSSSDVRATSYAVRYGGVCVMVLGTAGTVFSGNGTGTFKASCPMHINANSVTSGSLSLQVPYTCVSGSSSGPGWSIPPVQGCNTITDPLINVVQEPTTSMCNYTNAALSGSLPPGLYCFTNAGDVKINGNTTVAGNGVTLFFDANSYLTVSGGANVSLTAPKTGPLAGIALFQTRAPNASSSTFTLGGGGALSINGLIYLPQSSLNLSGTGGAASNYADVIVKTMSVSGTSSYNINSFGPSQLKPTAMIAHAALVIPH